MTTPAAPTTDLLLETGSGTDALLLLHAAGSGPRALARLAGLLQPAVGRTMAPAMTRAGRPLIGPPPAGLTAAAELVGELLGRAPSGRRIVLGHSMGGLVALLALTGGAAVDAAILYEPIVLSLLDADDAGDRAARDFDAAVIGDMQAAMARGEAEAGIARFVEAYGEHAWSALPPQARADLLRRAPAILAEAVATNATRLDRQALARLTVPVLVMHGTRSPDVAARMARRVAAALPRAELLVLEGAGHMAPVTSPELVARGVLAFLGRQIPTDAAQR